MSLIRRHRPDYARIAELEREIYGREFDHARPEMPEPKPRLRTSVAVILTLRWVLLADTAYLTALTALDFHRDWTAALVPALPLAVTATFWLACRKHYGTKGNRPASAYKAVAVKPPEPEGVIIHGRGEFWAGGVATMRYECMCDECSGHLD